MLATMARPRQARSLETRSRLLAAAAALIAEHGIDGASVDAIAERAGRTSGSLYGQFGSKDGLVVALLDQSKDVVVERILAEIEGATTIDERLAALWRNFVDPPPEARDWVRLEHELWTWANRPGNESARDRLGARYRAQYAAVAEALAEWAAEGLIDLPGPPERVATVVVATLVGLEMAARLDRGAVDEATAVATLRRIVGACDRPPVPAGDAPVRHARGGS